MTDKSFHQNCPRCERQFRFPMFDRPRKVKCRGCHKVFEAVPPGLTGSDQNGRDIEPLEVLPSLLPSDNRPKTFKEDKKAQLPPLPAFNSPPILPIAPVPEKSHRNISPRKPRSIGQLLQLRHVQIKIAGAMVCLMAISVVAAVTLRGSPGFQSNRTSGDVAEAEKSEPAGFLARMLAAKEFNPHPTFRFPQRIVAVEWKPDSRQVVVAGGMELEQQSSGSGAADLLNAIVPINETPGQSEGFIAIADLSTGKASTGRKMPFMVQCLATSPDNDILAVAGASSEVIMVDSESLKPIRSIRIEGLQQCEAMQFSNRGDFLAVGGSDGDAWLVSMSSEKVTHFPSFYEHVGLKGPSSHVEFHPSDEQILYGDHFGTTGLTLANLTGEKSIDRISRASFSPIRWSPDGSRSLGNFQNGYGVQNAGNAQPIELEPSLHQNVGLTEYEKFLQFHPTSPNIYAEVAYKGVLAQWSGETGRLKSQAQVAMGWVADMELSPDGEMVANIDDYTLRIWRHDGAPMKRADVPKDLLLRLAYAASEPYQTTAMKQPGTLLDQEDMEWCFQSGDPGLGLVCEGLGAIDGVRDRLNSQSLQWSGQVVGIGAFVAEYTSQDAAAMSFRPYDDLPDRSEQEDKTARMAAQAMRQWQQMQSTQRTLAEIRPRIWRRLLEYWPKSNDTNDLRNELFDLTVQETNPREIQMRYQGNQPLTNVLLRFNGIRTTARGGGEDPRVYFVPEIPPGTPIQLYGLYSLGRPDKSKQFAEDRSVQVELTVMCDQGTASFTSNCKTPQYRPEQNRLKKFLINFGIIYHIFAEEHGSGPSSLKELGLSGETAKEIESGEFVIIWGVDLRRQKQPLSELVMGYGRSPMASGERLVLMADGIVKAMPEDEFMKAPRALPKAK